MIRDAPRPEFEQALLRVAVSILIVTYMMWYLSQEHAVTPNDSNVLGAVILFFGVAALISIRIIVSPSPSTRDE